MSCREYDGLTFLESRAGAVADIQPPLPGTRLIELELPWALAPIAFNPRAIGARRFESPGAERIIPVSEDQSISNVAWTHARLWVVAAQIRPICGTKVMGQSAGATTLPIAGARSYAEPSVPR